MNYLLQYCADSRVPRTDHIMYSASHCSIMHLQEFSIEAGGVWGPAARRFFKECIALANDDRDIDLYLTLLVLAKV